MPRGGPGKPRSTRKPNGETARREAMAHVTAAKQPAKDGTKRGRPPLLLADPMLEARVLEGVRCFLSDEEACQRAGVTNDTFILWQHRAKDPQADPVYRDFFVKLQDARLDTKAAMGATLRAAGSRGLPKASKKKGQPGHTDPDPKWIAHILACRYPKEWSKTHQLQIEVIHTAKVRMLDALETVLLRLVPERAGEVFDAFCAEAERVERGDRGEESGAYALAAGPSSGGRVIIDAPTSTGTAGSGAAAQP